jgi:hypothetical protein
MTKISLAFLATVCLVSFGCKKKGGDTGDTAGGATPAGGTAPAGGAAPAAGGATPAAAACPSGFTNPGGVGACLKLPDGFTQDPSVSPAGGTKRVGFRADGGAYIDLTVENANPMGWEDKNKALLAGGGFGGKLVEQGKLGDDGVWGVFTADDGRYKMSSSRVRNKTTQAECLSRKEAASTVGPTVDAMIDVCKTIVLP